MYFSDFRDLDFRKNILEIANDFPESKFRSRDRARARPRALRGIPRVAVWGLALGPASCPGAPRCSGATFRGSHRSLRSSSSAAGCNMVQISEDFRTLNLVVTATAPARDRARYAGSRVWPAWSRRSPPGRPGWSLDPAVRSVWSRGPLGSSPIALEEQGGD